MSEKHSPLPWVVAFSGGRQTEIRSGGESGRRVAATFVQGQAKSREGYIRQAEANEANAAFIVEAVNSHATLLSEIAALKAENERLRGALTDLLSLFEDIDAGEHDDEPQFVAARAALAQGGGNG